MDCILYSIIFILYYITFIARFYFHKGERQIHIAGVNVKKEISRGAFPRDRVFKDTLVFSVQQVGKFAFMRYFCVARLPATTSPLSTCVLARFRRRESESLERKKTFPPGGADQEKCGTTIGREGLARFSFSLSFSERSRDRVGISALFC